MDVREAPPSSLISLNLTWTGSNSGPSSWEQAGNIDEKGETLLLTCSKSHLGRSLTKTSDLSLSLSLVNTFNQEASRTHDKEADSGDWGIGTKWDPVNPDQTKAQ